jgi:hypothetical protein
MPEEKPAHPIVFVRCTKGSDPATKGQTCNGRQAYKLSPDGHRSPMYKCTKCSHVFSVGLGGSFNV